MATLGDTFTAYVKPSLDGLMVIRKKNTIQTSKRLHDRKEEFAKKSPGDDAHAACKRDGKTVKKRVYVAGKGYEEKDVCPIKIFSRYLREELT